MTSLSDLTPGTQRTICWFSAGAPSAIATKLTLARYPDASVVYIDTGSEHDDTPRFIADCSRWFGREVEVIRSTKYEDTWDVWERTGYLVGVAGARCTVELKKVPRYGYERPDDIHVFGYTSDTYPNRGDFTRDQPSCSFTCASVSDELEALDG